MAVIFHFCQQMQEAAARADPQARVWRGEGPLHNKAFVCWASQSAMRSLFKSSFANTHATCSLRGVPPVETAVSAAHDGGIQVHPKPLSSQTCKSSQTSVIQNHFHTKNDLDERTTTANKSKNNIQKAEVQVFRCLGFRFEGSGFWV